MNIHTLRSVYGPDLVPVVKIAKRKTVREQNQEMLKCLRFIRDNLVSDGRQHQHILYSDCLHPDSDDKTVVDMIEEAISTTKL